MIVWIAYLALMAFVPLAYSTCKSVSRAKLKDRVFVKTVAKDYLRTLPTLAFVAIPVVAFPVCARGYVLALHVLFMPLVLLELGHIHLFGARMGLNTFYSLFITNMRETMEYLRNTVSPWQIASVVIAYLLPIGLLLNLPAARFLCGWAKVLALVGLALASIPLFRNFFKKGARHKPSYALNPFVSVFYHYALYRRQYDALKRQIKEHAAPKFEGITSLIPAEVPETYVICIGESANALHHAYAGYPRATNEFSQAAGDILSFMGVRSQYAQTLPSLEKTITFATDGTPGLLYEKGSIVDYFKDAGFKTFWLSNQYALEDTAITAMAGHADVRKCFNFSSMKGFETAGYDGTLVPELEKALQDSASKKVIFLHMIGSHAAYVNRYPAEFSHFTGAMPGKEGLSESARELLNAYDDSIRYTDFVISEFVRLLRASGATTAAYLMYFSDHGEDCYDTSHEKLLGHGQIANLPMTSVPLQIWLSPKLLALRPDLVRRMTKPKREYKLEQIIHLMIDLSSRTSADYDPRQSLFEEER